MADDEDFDGGLDIARAYYVMVLRDLLPLALGCHLVSIRGSDPVGLDNAVCWLVQVPSAGRSAQESLHNAADMFVARDSMFAYEAQWDAAVPGDVPLAFHDHRFFDDPSDELAAVSADADGQAYFEGTAMVTIAITGGDYDADEASGHWNRAFRLLVEWVDALRASNAGPLPAISDVESIHPIYVRVVELADGTRQVQNLITDTGGLSTKWHQPISREVTTDASRQFVERRFGNPTALVWDWAFRAISAKKLGDHGQAVIYCAIAAEQAISHALCMLQWEDNQRVKPEEKRDLRALFESRLRDSGKHLGRKLNFEHNVTNPGCAPEVQAWFSDIAQVRDRIMHSGHYPSALEADTAVEALYPFISYLSSRIAANAKSYPKCATVWCSIGEIEPWRVRWKVRRLKHRRDEFSWDYSQELQGI